jgi:hypothetical protein
MGDSESMELPEADAVLTYLQINEEHETLKQKWHSVSQLMNR